MRRLTKQMVQKRDRVLCITTRQIRQEPAHNPSARTTRNCGSLSRRPCGYRDNGDTDKEIKDKRPMHLHAGKVILHRSIRSIIASCSVKSNSAHKKSIRKCLLAKKAEEVRVPLLLGIFADGYCFLLAQRHPVFHLSPSAAARGRARKKEKRPAHQD